MEKLKISLGLVLVMLGGLFQTLPAVAVEYDKAALPLLKRPFFYGRDYFVLGSGRMKMIVQADKADLGPAFLYLLFDADNVLQSKDKHRALNFADGQGMVNSALEVVLGGHAFTAFGHQTQTRWTVVDGIPAVEAVWWAGGLRVTERIFALTGKNAFVRRIQLDSVNLAGPEKATLRLSLPPGKCAAQDGTIVQISDRMCMMLHSFGKQPREALTDKAALEIGPLTLAPGQSASLDTVLLALVGAKKAPEPPTNADFSRAVKKTQAYWAETSSLATDDAVVQELFRSVRFGLPGMISPSGTADCGMLEYGEQVVRDVANTMLTVLHFGQFELARNGLEHILRDMIRDKGEMMIASKFDEPDREELDQMGELMHALKAYRDWTGDDSLIRQYRAKLLAMIQRPLQPEFRGPSGMVHDRREFWERTVDDGYELAYQTYMVVGLRDAAELAEPLGVPDRAARWRAEADRILKAMLEDPQCSLVRDGRFIKRCTSDGRWVKTFPSRPRKAGDVTSKTEIAHLAEPDTTAALPIVFGLVDPRSEIARNTLDHLEGLWNARWSGGGYGRYHTTSDDQPGAWMFGTCFVMRAQHAAGLLDCSRRSLEWLYRVPGGRTGAWPEEIPAVRSTLPGILPWNAAEVGLFIVRHWLGVGFEGNRLTLRPALYAQSGKVTADLRFRRSRLKLEITGPGPITFAELDGRRIEPDKDGVVRLPAGFAGGRVVLHAGEKE